MQIVIDDEKIIDLLETEWGYEGIREDVRRLLIENGKQLPKGHGRLIDADRLKIDNPLHLSLDIPYVTEDTVEEIIDHAQTIIEADKESEE